MEFIIRDYHQADNQGLADMWNESQSAWPTGFGGNVAFTAERVAEDMKRQQSLFYLVAEVRGKIIGYCWVSSYPREPDACYVSLLNVHPAYHGQGVGKGLLMESIKRAFDLGYYRIDLHTWPANIKAVPLYKKTGFFWLPETQVHMQNYIPAVLRHPLGRDFFAKHDWYFSFVRDLDQVPDEIKIGQRRVFPYRFQAENEFLEMIFDMESRRVCAVETNRVRARLVLDDPEVIVGRRQRLEVEYESKQKESFHVTWLKPKNSKIRLKPQGLAAELLIDSEVEAPEEQLPAISIGARVAIGGLSFKLETGIRPKQPLDLEWHPRYPDSSGRRQLPVVLTMINNTGKRARVSLDIKHRRGVRARIDSFGRLVDRDGKTGCLVETMKKSPGVNELLIRAKVRAGREILCTKRYRMPLFNIGYGHRPVLWHGDRTSVWETPGFRAVVERRGGVIWLIDKQRERNAAIIESVLGPPFWPNEFSNIEFQVNMRKGGLVVSAGSQRIPGLRFEKLLTLVGERAIEMRFRVVNGAKGSGIYQVDLSVWGEQDSPNNRKIIPLKQGCIGISGPNPFGGINHELPHEVSDWAENWWAIEDGESVTGIVWETAKKINYPRLELSIGQVKSGASGQTPAVTMVFGPGDHSLVRRWYLERQKGQSPEDYQRMEVIPRMSAAFDPPVLFLGRDEGQSKTMLVRNLSNQDMPAALDIHLPDGQSMAASSPSVKLGHDFRREIAINWKGENPAEGTITGTIGLHPIEGKYGIIPIGGIAEPISIVKGEERGKEVWFMDNGLCRFKVSPQFLGSVFSWIIKNKEHLLSSFPEPGNFSWERPWYGGIAPVLHLANSWGKNLLIKEKFSASQVSVEGKTGLLWQGVRMTCHLADKKAKGLLIEISYLTLSRCSVMAIVTSFKNTMTGCMHFSSELMGFVTPGGGYRGTKLCWDECGRERTYLRGDKGAWILSERWGAAENPETGETVIVAIPRDYSTQSVLLIDYGRDGGHLGQAMDIRLKVDEARSFLGFWGVAGCAEEARALRHLADLKELP